ncbi:hypothetical protein EV360DRAFT_75770 [Lentinula raphanica]|nr:hypothetical protein EV360DRAFT_75770 [Lentinula raphanica]
MAGAYTYLISLTLAFVATLCMLEFEEAFYQGVFDNAILNVIYPLMKRITYLPQAWLGLAINWGFVVAWVNVSGRGSSMTWDDFKILAYGVVSLASWTIVYDTIYACQDLNDDKRAGAKSTALLFGSYLPYLPPSTVSYIGYFNGQGVWFYTVSVIGSAIHMNWQLGTHSPMNAASCNERFDSNISLGGIVAGGLLADYLFRVVI